MRPLGGSATSCAPAAANTSRFRCRSISSPSIGSGTSVPPAVSLSVPSALRAEAGPAARSSRPRPGRTGRRGRSSSGAARRAAAGPAARTPAGGPMASGTRNDCCPWCGDEPVARRTGRGAGGGCGSPPWPGRGRRSPRANAAALSTLYPAESLADRPGRRPTAPAARPGPAPSRRPLAVCCSMNATSSSRDWNLSCRECGRRTWETSEWESGCRERGVERPDAACSRDASARPPPLTRSTRVSTSPTAPPLAAAVVGDACRSQSPQRRRRGPAPSADGHRQRPGFSGIGHRRVFEQVPLLDAQRRVVPSRRGIALRLPRHEPDRPAAQHALLVQPEHVLGERHALRRTSSRRRSARGCTSSHSHMPTGGNCVRLCAHSTTGLSRYSSSVAQPGRARPRRRRGRGRWS